jgi:hypothetical protein
LLDQPHRVASLTRKLAAEGFERTDAAVAALLDRWLRLGVVFTDDGQFVHVVPVASNQELIRIATAEPADDRELAEVAS